MEFRDNTGVRRFFRIEDQLKIASNETLKDMQSKLDINEEDEAEFYRQLQLQIEENDRRLGKKTSDQRKRKLQTIARCEFILPEVIMSLQFSVCHLLALERKVFTHEWGWQSDRVGVYVISDLYNSKYKGQDKLLVIVWVVAQDGMRRGIFLKLLVKLEEHCNNVLVGSEIDYHRLIAQRSIDQNVQKVHRRSSNEKVVITLSKRNQPIEENGGVHSGKDNVARCNSYTDPHTLGRRPLAAVRQKLEVLEEGNDANELLASGRHGPDWLVGRRGDMAGSEKGPTTPQPCAADLKQITQELETKFNRKLQDKMAWMLKKLGEANSGMNIDVRNFCVTKSSDHDENGTPFASGTHTPGTEGTRGQGTEGNTI
ncbi:hypothetical protein AgCh_005114 [Apium graveolens]